MSGTDETQTAAPARQRGHIPPLMVLAAGILWGLSGAFTRTLSGLGFTVVDLVLLRNTGSALLLGAYLLLRDRAALRIRARHIPIFLGSGILSLLVFTLCYFKSQQLNSLAVAAILLYTAPAFVMLLSRPLFRERITGKKLAALLLAFAGCVLASGALGGDLSMSRLGVLLGLGSGLFYATYSIFARLAMRYYGPLTATFYTMAFASAGALVLAACGVTDFSAAVWSGQALLCVLALVVLSTVAAYLLYTRGLQGLGDAGKASILASIEPVAAAAVGAIAFGEPLGLGVAGGLACILASAIILR